MIHVRHKDRCKTVFALIIIYVFADKLPFEHTGIRYKKEIMRTEIRFFAEASRALCSLAKYPRELEEYVLSLLPVSGVVAYAFVFAPDMREPFDIVPAGVVCRGFGVEAERDLYVGIACCRRDLHNDIVNDIICVSHVVSANNAVHIAF